MEYTHRSAELSENGVHRYTLARAWSAGATAETAAAGVCWIMLNPSTADHRMDDPTIRRCRGFSESWGFDGFTVVNLFSFRTSSPAELRKSGAIGAPLGEHIFKAASSAGLVVAAWGVHGEINDRGIQVQQLLSGRGIRVKCFGLTRNGQPIHPLYQRRDAELVDLARIGLNRRDQG